ncbi:putative ribosome-binding factor A, mitochondrial [Apostichopus japonicus]|uniref:Putative ribosome-binding factor A, mitochondrial n=1 Tax=Stichopus japonicus TaxID=307972 RepID=A0A2G8LMM0_STIJA|nr:putative ribosome-binding factor A, mitochondrial [Apostichopus japonicus]
MEGTLFKFINFILGRVTFYKSYSSVHLADIMDRTGPHHTEIRRPECRHKYSFDAVSHTQLGSMVNHPPRQRTGAKMMGPEESVKLKTYNTILHEHVDQIMNSGVISQELQDVQVSIVGVRLTGDMSTCRIYWQASGNHEDDQRIQTTLDSHARQIRHELINHRVLGKIPQIAFLQEKTAAMKAEVDRLLEMADFPAEDSGGGPEETESWSEPSLDTPLDQKESIDKFKNSVKRRQKGRVKGLYNVESHGKDGLEEFDEQGNNNFDEELLDEDDKREDDN